MPSVPPTPREMVVASARCLAWLGEHGRPPPEPSEAGWLGALVYFCEVATRLGEARGLLGEEAVRAPLLEAAGEEGRQAPPPDLPRRAWEAWERARPPGARPEALRRLLPLEGPQDHDSAPGFAVEARRDEHGLVAWARRLVAAGEAERAYWRMRHWHAVGPERASRYLRLVARLHGLPCEPAWCFHVVAPGSPAAEVLRRWARWLDAPLGRADDLADLLLRVAALGGVRPLDLHRGLDLLVEDVAGGRPCADRDVRSTLLARPEMRALRIGLRVGGPLGS